MFTTPTVKLQAGETVRAESGAMVSMSPTMELKAKKQGKGLGGMLKAAVGGEGLFASEFTATDGAGELVLAPPTPGDIISFELQGNTILAQSGAYLAGSLDLELSTQGSFKAMISGEGLFLQKISGTGRVFLNSYGAVFEKKLTAGEHYKVDTGHLVAFEETVTYTVRKAAKGLFSTIVSGEGLVCDFEGPGSLWIQSRNLKGFAAVISNLLPKQSR
ncbi:hypothetical protein ES703_124722 [subsurface metagenome]